MPKYVEPEPINQNRKAKGLASFSFSVHLNCSTSRVRACNLSNANEQLFDFARIQFNQFPVQPCSRYLCCCCPKESSNRVCMLAAWSCQFSATYRFLPIYYPHKSPQHGWSCVHAREATTTTLSNKNAFPISRLCPVQWQAIHQPWAMSLSCLLLLTKWFPIIIIYRENYQQSI